MPKKLAELTAELEDQQLYQGLMNYLRSRNAVPQMRQGTHPDEAGSFEHGKNMPPEGLITVNQQANRGTIPHELTHAAENQMIEQYYRGNPGPQYAQAYEKLYKNEGRHALAARLDPEWAKDNRGYRSANYELGPWGVGNMMTGHNTEGAPAHLDSTMATETEILADLARRDQQRKQRPRLEQIMAMLGL